MRIVLLIVLYLGSYTLWGQNPKKLTLNYQNAPLEEVLSSISTAAGVEISYSSSKIPVEEKVNAEFRQETLEAILKEVLKDFPVSFQIQGDRIILRQTNLRQTVRGNVRDADSGAPVFGATVVVLGSDPILGATTDERGDFRIEKVPVGRRTLRVQSVGFQDKDLVNILINTGKETVLDINIKESITRMKELVVRGVGVGAQPVNELATVSGRSFTEEETRRYAASVGDPTRLVTAYAGVVQGDDGTNEIIIRGNSPRGLLWKLEGVEIPSPNHFSSEGTSTGGISMFSTQVIARSDFFTGAFPSEYGNALSGVFDIKLRRGNNERSEYTLQAGLLGLDVAAEGPFRPGGEASFLFNYRYSTLALLTGLGFNLQDENEKNIFQDLSFKVHMPTKKAGTFSLFGLGGLSTFKENIAGSFDDFESYDMGVIGLTHDYLIKNDAYLKTTVSWSGTKLLDDFNNKSVAPNTARSDTEFNKSYIRTAVTYGKKFNAQHLLEVGGIYSALSYDFKQSSVNTFREEPFVTIESFKDQGNSGSWQGYATYKYHFNDKLSLVGGAHVLHFNFNNETTFEPRAGLTWQFKENQSINAGFGFHSRIESLEYYLGRYIDLSGNSQQFNGDLEVTKARHYVLGYNRQLAPDWFLRLEGYYQDLYDVPVVEDPLDIQDPTYPSYAAILFFDGYTSLPLVNKGSATNYGVELTLEKSFSNNYFLLLTGALYESKYKGSDGVERDSRFNGKFNNTLLAGREFRVGNNGLNNTIGINFRSSWSGSQRYTPVDLPASIAAGQAVSRLEDVYTERFPNYYRLDFQLSYRKNKPRHTSEWRLDIQNLTNRENILQQLYLSNQQRTVFEKQLGLIPILSYRVQF